MLGPNNEEAAKEALQAWPGKLQVGGGINDGNARHWIEAGAEKVCLANIEEICLLLMHALHIDDWLTLEGRSSSLLFCSLMVSSLGNVWRRCWELLGRIGANS